MPEATMTGKLTARQGGEGWGWPPISRKAHYIEPDGRSLCGKIGFAFDLPLEQGNDGSPDNCAECRRRLNRRTR
jgi:hypothetical protein